MGVYVRDKGRVAEAVTALRAEPWCEAAYCQDAQAACDRTLESLHAYFPGRSPDVMVDLDDDAALNFPQAGQHGSLRHDDMAIPLFLSGAGIEAGKVGGEARLVDIAPTVMRLLGLPPEGLRPDGRVLEEGALYLEGADAVAGGDDDVVGAADEPEVAVLVAGGAVAGDVPFATPGRGRRLGILPVLEKHRRCGAAQREIAHLARRALAATVVDDAQLVPGERLAHRARTDRQAGKVGGQELALGLAVAVLDHDAEGVVPGVYHLGF